MNGFNDYLAETAAQHGVAAIGFHITINDDGNHSFYFDVKGHSIPVESSDAKSMTMIELARKYL